MSQLRELYQQLIIDHGRRPRNFGELADATHTHEGFNPLCGDRLVVYLMVKDGVISQVKFKGQGCAISMASASLMSELLGGKTVAEGEKIFTAFHQMITDTENSDQEKYDLGKLKVLAGVREYPARVKCASLAWHTVLAAMQGESGCVKTE